MNRIEIVVIKPAAALSAFADRRRQVVIEHGTGFDEGYPVRVLVPPRFKPRLRSLRHVRRTGSVGQNDQRARR
jgi:hypothetical protein